MTHRVTPKGARAKRAASGQDATAPEILTSEQAAKLLQVSCDTLLALKDGPPWFAVGGGRRRPRRRYLRSSLIEWARRRQAAA